MLNHNYLWAAVHFIGTALTLKILNHVLPVSVTSYYTFIANLLLFIILSWYLFVYLKKSYMTEKIDPQNKAVLITGCDSGFGHNLAKRLDTEGFAVFATCMFPFGKGAEELRNSCTSRLKILELDVTKEESVEDAVSFVEQNLGSSELWAIVNNAGIAKGLSAELSSIQDFKDCMEVNVYGMVRVTKAFIPRLKISRGRVVNMTSFLGRVPIPHLSPYVVSKHAAVGLSDSLRQELVDRNIDVISIEPELFKTGLTSDENAENNWQSTFNALNQKLKQEYDEEYQNNFKKSQTFFLNLASSDIHTVIDDLESAITLKYPESVYYPRRNHFVRLIFFVYMNSPIPIRDFFGKIVLLLLRYKKPKSVLHSS